MIYLTVYILKIYLLKLLLTFFEFEKAYGLIISVGGQRPNNLAKKLSIEGFHILGTRASDINRAEDRNLFSALLDKLHIVQPKWQSFTDMKSAIKFTERKVFQF